jgi:hypothetical protein
MQQAASITLRTVPGAPVAVDYGDESALADELATRSAHDKEGIEDAVDTYVADLDAAGLNDTQMMTAQRSRGSFLWRIGWNAAVGLLLVPFAIVGFVINIIPILLVRLVGRAKVDPAMMATIKPVAAIVVFSITWAIAAWAGWRLAGFSGAAAVLLLMPIYVYALVALAERGTLVVRAVRGWVGSGGTDLHSGVLEHRSAVVEAVVDAL